MPAPKSSLILVTAPPAQSGKVEFWVSDTERMEDGEGDWGFAVYTDKDVFLATFTYPSQDAALRAREAIIPVLREAVFIATAES